MKFLCIDCDEQMRFEERQVPGDGTFAASFRCPTCNRRIALLANPMETQLVGALGVQIGGRTLDEQPMELVRSSLVGRDDAFVDPPAVQPEGDARVRPRWSAESEERLARVPGFVRGMVKRIYGEYAAERGIAIITPAVMDQARQELGLEGM
ncbi:MAG: PCP reductase family protein [Gemmatimonadota bacterium]|nr:PCP reductase family protein [Gemmatimonadota bacterium]